MIEDKKLKLNFRETHLKQNDEIIHFKLKSLN